MYHFQSTSALYQNYPYQSNLDLLFAEGEIPFDRFIGQLHSASSLSPTYPIPMMQPNHHANLTYQVHQNQEFSAYGNLNLTHPTQQNQNFSAHGMNPQVPIYHQASHAEYLNYQVIRHMLAQPEPHEPVPPQPQPSEMQIENGEDVLTTHRSRMINPQVPMYHQATHEQYLNYQVIGQILEQQEPVPRQTQGLEMHVERGEEVLQVEMEHPFLGSGKPRLRWTAALHARFLRAALDLGGIHRATPKGILRNMNVRGLTVDHVKSHLQKVRLRDRQGISLEDFVAHGIQADVHGGARRVSRRTVRGNGANVQATRMEAPESIRFLRAHEASHHHHSLGLLNNFGLANY